MKMKIKKKSAEMKENLRKHSTDHSMVDIK